MDASAIVQSSTVDFSPGSKATGGHATRSRAMMVGVATESYRTFWLFGVRGMDGL